MTEYGVFTKKDTDTATAVINAVNKKIEQSEKENLVFGKYFADEKFTGQGETQTLFRDISDADYKNGALYVAPGSDPISLKEKLTTWTITLKPSMYVSADVEKESASIDPLPKTLARNLAVAKQAILEGINNEMGNQLLAGALDNSGVPVATGGSYWYNSGDSGAAQLPPRFGENDFVTDGHTVTFVDDAAATQTLNGHVETTKTDLNTDHLLAIKRHLQHHSNKANDIELIANGNLIKEIILLGSISASGDIPDKLYEMYFKEGDVTSKVGGFVISKNEYIPDKLALFVLRGSQPGVRLINIPLKAFKVDDNRKRIFGAAMDYRAGYGIKKRGAGYVAYFDI